MKFKLILVALLVLLAAGAGASTVAWNIWYAESHAPTTEAGAVEKGRQALAAQLAASEKSEAEIEKTYWNQPEKLKVLVTAHQQRIDKLATNPAATEIVSHDKQAVEKLQQRIQAIYIQREAEAEAAAEAEKQAEEEARQQALADRAAAQGKR